MRALSALLVTLATQLLCSRSDIALASQQSDVPAQPPSVSCPSLVTMAISAGNLGLPAAGGKVTRADLISADAAKSEGEYCLIEGEIAPLDLHAASIHFSAALPSRWNHKTMHLGGGGFGGRVVSPAEPHPLVGSPSLLARGYAVMGSDSGHTDATGLDTSFALNDEELENFAGAQLKKVHDAVGVLIKAYYGSAPTHSYFLGGSEGGREAFTVVQMYPQDYDGVIAWYPAHALVADILKVQMIRRAVLDKGAEGSVNGAKLEFLHELELAACDKSDGLEDSIIGHVEACRIDFKKWGCPNGQEGARCFSAAQLETLHALYAPSEIPYVLADGGSSLPAFFMGTQWWLPPSPITDSTLGVPVNQQVVAAFLRNMVLRDAGADTLQFDPMKPGRYFKRLQEVSSLLDRTSTNLDAFIARHGKWIILQGAADQGVPPSSTIDYYKKVRARFGQEKTDAFLRFYLIPGFGHGSGVFAPDGAPAIAALEGWVERGASPGTLIASDTNPQRSRQRPLCQYPARPQYAGRGDSNVAASFSCAKDPRK